MTLALYGHHFSSYTWKALIALYGNETPFEFRAIGPESPEHAEVLSRASPLGKFPLLVDGGREIFEASAIIEYLALYRPGAAHLLPNDPDAALTLRMMDRVFDNYVMNVMQEVVNEHLREPQAPDPVRCGEARAQLDRSYAWLEAWLGREVPPIEVNLLTCAAAPSLFYADWVHPLGDRFPRLAAWRAELLALPAVARCVDDARPYRQYFPLGAPDRD